MTAYLLVIGDREALGWLLTEQRMAFPGTQRAEVRALAADDTLLLYTTRGCFKNPTRDPGRIIATGRTRSAVTTLDEPVQVGGRSFPAGCDVEFRAATPWPDGVELGPVVGELDSFAGMERNWSIRLRRPLVPLSDRDASVLDGYLTQCQPRPLEEVIEPYAHWWRSTL